MQLSLLSLLLTIAISLIFLGYYSKERAYSLVGFSFLFILGFWSIMAGGIDYNTGATISYSYDNSTLTSTTITETTQNINDNIIRFFGVWMSVLGVIGVSINVAETRGGYK